MPEEKATQQGAEKGEVTKQKAFPDPKIPEGLDKPDETGDDTSRPLSTRDQAIADIEAKAEERLSEELRQGGEELEALYSDQPGEEQDDALEPGLDHQEQIGEEERSDIPKELRDDPLKDYIVMEGDTPMFKTKVDGETRLIPVEAARTQLQKHVAAEIRLQHAAEKNKVLDAREAEIRKNEAALAEKLLKGQTERTPSVPPDVSDTDLENEAREVVNSLFSGTEDDAVKNLTKFLGRTQKASAPPVDKETLVNEAVAASRKQLEAERAAERELATKKAQSDGFSKFSSEYSDIVADSNLFRYADGLTDQIETEHPEWSPYEVMAEAGRQTRDWVQHLKGAAPESEKGQNSRQNKKRTLTPMPRPASAQRDARPEPERTETPQSLIEQIRKARGQGG